MDLDKNAAVVKELRTLFNVGVAGDLTDGQLLERFATDRGEAAELAFTVLVERHGPMVLRVCRSVLAGEYEADDVFQATFLVLVKKARGLWVRDSLGPWLHQVAFRTASRARLAAARRRRHEERAAAARPEAHTMNRDDLDGLLHEEIEKLPERYRAPVVLCDLEGCSHQQAARHLGWPLGTVKSRQARGRERLRDRLRRRSLAPNLGLLGGGRIFTGPNPLVPPALVESTTRSAVQFVTCQTAVRASTLALSQEVLKAMSFTRWLKSASVLFVVVATVSGAGMFAQRRAPAAPLPAGEKLETTRADEPVTIRVTPGPLNLTIVERGSLESARNMDAFCDVEGGTSIMTLIPEGTRVKKGDTICQLDSAALRDQLTNADIAIKDAEVDYQNATAAREVAEIAVTAFLEGTYKHELNTVKGEMAIAESAVKHAERRLDRARRAQKQVVDLLASKKNAVAPSDILAELDIDDRIDASEQSISREKAALEQAKARQELLEKYTRDRTLKALALDVERKRPDEMAKNSKWHLEQGRAKKLERQIAACTIKAPNDGIVVYANPPRRVGERFPTRIEEGAQVRERQKILSLPDLSLMRVTTTVNEAQVHMIRNGMKAKIRIDAFPNQLFDGTVVQVAPRPEPKPMMQGDAPNVYSTKVKIDAPIPGLRPGMSSQVEFLVANRENALSVPVQAVLSYAGKGHLAVRKPGGEIELRAVSVGLSNDKLIEITQGIQSGDTVVLNPAALMSDREQTHLTQPSTSSESSRTPQGRKP
jgi:HlyD family secretion protein